MRAALALGLVGLAVAAWLWPDGATSPRVRPRSAAASDATAQAPVEDDELPPLRFGEVEVSLTAEPVAGYGAEVSGGGYRELVERALRGRASFDPNLSRAAREYTVHAAIVGTEPSDRIMSFLLHSSGAPDYTVFRLVITTSNESDAAVEQAVEQALDRVGAPRGKLFVGVGETFAAGEGRRIGVLIADRELAGVSADRSVPAGSTWEVRGTTTRRFDRVFATALWPSGRLAEVPARVSGREVAIDVPAGDDRGVVWLSIDGVDDERGPVKLTQLSAVVAEPAPRQRIFEIPAEEEWSDLESAERFAHELINRDRAALGLPALELDAALSAVARAHSRDMRDHRFFAHRSPKTGTVLERLRKAGYRARRFAENLARNDRIAEAQASLMWSVGHRKNLVSTNYSRVGVGVARGEDGFYLTQIFAEPAGEVRPDEARARLISRIDEERRRLGLESLSVNESLQDLLEAAALRAGSEPAEASAAVLARSLRQALPGGAQILLVTAADPGAVELPEVVLSQQVGELMIAVSLAEDGLYRIALVAVSP